MSIISKGHFNQKSGLGIQTYLPVGRAQSWKIPRTFLSNKIWIWVLAVIIIALLVFKLSYCTYIRCVICEQILWPACSPADFKCSLVSKEDIFLSSIVLIPEIWYFLSIFVCILRVWINIIIISHSWIYSMTQDTCNWLNLLHRHH